MDSHDREMTDWICATVNDYIFQGLDGEDWKPGGYPSGVAGRAAFAAEKAIRAVLEEWHKA